MSVPQISVIVLNYNGQQWLERCMESLAKQTLENFEIILADNASTDRSDALAEKLAGEYPRTKFVQNGFNAGFCEGNNLAAKHASGDYLLFLNNDTTLEPTCLEELLKETERTNATAATPLVLDYDAESFQSLGARGFDIFGLPTARTRFPEARKVLMPEGCSYLIQRGAFHKIGEFDRELFMYADELDLSWRVWISGGTAWGLPKARLHHRGAANVNPAGGAEVVELRTSAFKRHYTNRNCLLVILKNAQHVLLLLALLQVGLLLLESIVALLLTKNWGFVRRAYFEALRDCWRMRGHVRAERARIRAFRRRSDFAMLRFLRLRPSRWDDLARVARYGPPKV